MKLKNLLKERFCQVNLRLNENLKNDFAILDQFVADFFPDKEEIKKLFKGLTISDKNFTYYYNANFLPFHTRDNGWLADYVERALSQLYSLSKDTRNAKKESAKKILPFRNLSKDYLYFTPYRCVTPVDFKSIEKYVKLSPKFNEKRCEYEQDLTTVYLDNWLVGNTSDFYRTADAKARIKKAPNYDKLLRENVLGAMKTLGVNKKSAEISLELNGNSWREVSMYKAFYNEKGVFNKEQLKFLAKKNFPLLSDLLNKELEYAETWVRLRKNEYYEAHKGLIDELGLSNHHKRLSSKQLANLRAQNQQREEQYEIASHKAMMIISDNESTRRLTELNASI